VEGLDNAEVPLQKGCLRRGLAHVLAVLGVTLVEVEATLLNLVHPRDQRDGGVVVQQVSFITVARPHYLPDLLLSQEVID